MCAGVGMVPDRVPVICEKLPYLVVNVVQIGDRRRLPPTPIRVVLGFDYPVTMLEGEPHVAARELERLAPRDREEPRRIRRVSLVLRDSVRHARKRPPYRGDECFESFRRRPTRQGG